MLDKAIDLLVRTAHTHIESSIDIDVRLPS